MKLLKKPPVKLFKVQVASPEYKIYDFVIIKHSDILSKGNKQYSLTFLTCALPYLHLGIEVRLQPLRDWLQVSFKLKILK